MARADRFSNVITRAQVEGFCAAAHHAALIGLPLDTHLTVHWGKLPGDGAVQQRLGRLLTCARRWLARRGVRLACVWVVERGGRAGGLHTHALLHVPHRLLADFTAMLPIWTGVPPLPEADRPKDARSYTRAIGRDRIWQLDRVRDHGAGLRRYLLKGANDGWLRYGIRHRPQGRVVGKRVGVSNSLGPAARARRWANGAGGGAPLEDPRPPPGPARQPGSDRAEAMTKPPRAGPPCACSPDSAGNPGPLAWT